MKKNIIYIGYKKAMLRNIVISSILATVPLTIIGTFDTTHELLAAKSSGFKQILSESTDFPGDDANAVKVDVTTAKKDITGSYHVKGEIKNLGSNTLQYVRVTAHFYDESNQTVGVTTCCYANPTDIEPGRTSTFDSFAQKDDMSGTPKSFRLSFDWD